MNSQKIIAPGIIRHFLFVQTRGDFTITLAYRGRFVRNWSIETTPITKMNNTRNIELIWRNFWSNCSNKPTIKMRHQLCRINGNNFIDSISKINLVWKVITFAFSLCIYWDLMLMIFDDTSDVFPNTRKWR